MVFTGTQEVKYYHGGKLPIIEVTAVGFKADGEFAADVDFDDTPVAWFPTVFGMILERTVGTTNTVSVKLQGTLEPALNVWDDLITITDVTGGASVHDWFPTYNFSAGSKESPVRIYHSIRILCTTVGTGNTITVHMHCGSAGL